ncbi:unnamed protein product [Cyclocybe aegerita]|uniref:JmjC domain-containing protein n=1 Tax=Cyclocybe aegerita TaxID=1973307 RepID=A0A8S0WYP4_CYCAE|nr:unnamed protein product [Cyclocybe aegerita]
MVDDPSKRKSLNGTHMQRHYLHQHPQMGPQASAHGYTDMNDSRMMARPRMSESREYADGSTVWHQQSQHHLASMPYGAPVMSPLYSDERTALSGDYQSQSTYPSSYEEQARAPSDAQSWQATERASVRIAAQSTVPESSNDSHGMRYTSSSTTAYYSNLYTTQPPYPQMQEPVPVSAPPQRLSSEPPRTSGAPSTSTKRQQPDSEAEPAPKAKRPKAKVKSTATGTGATSSTAGTSKRGYNAKKRSEAALISAQNASALQRAGTVAYNAASGPGDADPLPPLIPELQFARCMSNRYRKEEFPRCVSCTRRWAGDTCRFQGIRYLMRDADRNLRGLSFNERNALMPTEGTKMEYPTKWNREFERSHVRRTKLAIAKALLPILKAEFDHLNVPEIVRRPRETDVRATCDTCITSIFSTSFMCRLCGREVCNECYQQVRELTEQPHNATPAELAALANRRERHAHANPFFLSCTKRNEHGVVEFTPVTRFVRSELEKAIKNMEKILQSEKADDTPASVAAGTTPLMYSQLLSHPSMPFPDPLITPVFDDFIVSNLTDANKRVPTLQAQVISAAMFDPRPPNSSSTTPATSFASLWQQGKPLLVKDCQSRFKLRWDPEYFIQKYGDQGCLIVECQTDVNRRVTIRDFFSDFGKYEGRTECWKLKDWPPTAEFKTAFPELYEDFSNAVPVPDYVRRDGVENLGSHFPTNAVGPDLGPKMYNAMASTQEPGTKGSTRLHMDMADALNVMLYATPCEDGTPGYAAWDLFKAEDSDKIRAYLRKKFGPGGAGAKTGDKASAAAQAQLMTHDPIHGQQFYLDAEMRMELAQACDVRAIRIYQRPGDGIFIPAGCAHQVANMSDCMKIAIDFVSPENIDRCEKLTKEFREQNQSKVWKEDVLQLRTMMWFAWQSCCSKEAEMDNDDSALGGSAGSSVAAARNGVRVIEGPASSS